MRNKPLLIYALATMNCLSCRLAGAQETPRVLSFTKEQYQAYNQNWSVSQMPDRTMLFGNSAGLLTFDGSTWQTYALPNKQIIRAVANDGKGRVFTGAYSEFGYWQRGLDGRFHYQTLNTNIKDEQFLREEIWHILPLGNRVLFQSFSVLYLYDYQTITRLLPPGNMMFAQEVDGRLLLPVIGQGLFEFQGAGFRQLPGAESLADKTIVCVLPGTSSSLLVGTANHGIFEYRDGQLRPWSKALQPLLIANQLNKGIRLANGYIALGTILNGVFIVNAAGEIVYHLNQQNGLQNNTVLALLEDATHNLWVGLDKGIDLIELNSPLNFFKDKNGTVGAVYAAAIFNGDLYIGSNRGVFVRPWCSSNERTATFRLINGTQGQVWQIEQFGGQLLVGHNDGTFLIENGQVRQISDVTGGWCTLAHPNNPDVLVQSTYTGLIILTKDQRGRWRFSHRLGNFREPVNKIRFDNVGNLWAVGAYRGLYCFRLDDSLHQITDFKGFTEEDGLPSAFKVDIEYIGEQLIVKSNSGFFAFDAIENRLRPIASFNGRSLSDQQLRIKAGRNKDWFQVAAQRIFYHNGNHDVVFNLPLAPDYESIIPLLPDIYLLGLDDGYAIFTPSKLAATDAAAKLPSISITAIASFNRRREQYHPPSAKIIQFPASEHNVRFRFSQSVFTRQPEYSYWLEGFDDHWSAWQTLPEKEFSRLPPGEYTFKVRSNLSPDIAAVRFVIRAPWYRTSWAAAFYVLLAGLLIWSVERWNQHRLEAQRRHLEAEKEKQLEEQRIKAANERLYADVIGKSKELANSTMNLIRKNEILRQIKEEILSIRASGEGHSLSKHYQRLLHLIDTNISSEQDWQVFETNFNQVHETFFKKLKADFPELTPSDLKLAAYLKMNLSTKEIAPLLNISIRSVENKRYRLRKKLRLDEDENLPEFMMRY